MSQHKPDGDIVELYFARSEEAIAESEKKYGQSCYAVAYRILCDHGDAEECVNDTWLRAWNAIPPEKPTCLGAYLCTITRRLALTRYEYKHASRRFAGVEASLEELSECIPEGCLSVMDEVVIRMAINSFLDSLPTRTRMIFLRKYWYLDSISGIAEALGMSEAAVKVSLHRTREKFRKWLAKEGVFL